jgi:hypothetical protein
MYNIYHKALHTKGSSDYFTFFIILLLYLKVRQIVFCFLFEQWLNDWINIIFFKSK